MEILLKGDLLANISPLVKGDDAPDFTLTDLDGNEVTLSKIDKPVLISTFPDINTPTCSLQTKRFNEEAAKNKDVEFLSISANTKDEQKSWCAAEGVDMKVLADDGSFGKAYGLTFTDGVLKDKLARAIYVIVDGQIAYSDIVMEIADEPSYNAALAVISELKK
jgi:thiol peroxidase